MSQIDLSIVIVSYNVRDLLAQCLRAVVSRQMSVVSSQMPVVTQGRRLEKDDGRLTAEIFVVDNASSDGSAAMVREGFPSVCLMANTENRGFAAANNQAFAESRGRYILMLNPDTAVRAGALETLVKFM